jgi:hypothetical protein
MEEEIKYLSREECIEKLINECRFYKVDDVWHITGQSIGIYKNKIRYLLRISIEYYTSFLSVEISHKERLYYFINDIKEIIEHNCKVCGKETTFKKFYIGYHDYCSIKCQSNCIEIRESRKQTKLKKYGNENYNNREGAKETCRNKYGVENVSQYIEIKEQKKKSSQNRYGTDYTLQAKTVRDDIKATCNKKYGGNAPTCSEEVVKLRNKNYLEKTGYLFPAKNPEVRESYKNTCLENYGVDHYSKTDEFKQSMIEAWENFSEEKLNSISQKHINFQKNRTQESIISMINNCRMTYYNKTGYYHNTYNPNSMIYLNKKGAKSHKKFVNIYYESNDELYFLNLIDDLNLNSYIKRGPFIKYKNLKNRYYIVDFEISFPNKKYLIEIKGTHSYFFKDLFDGTLFAKWKAAEKYCKENNYKEYIFILNKKIISQEEIINEYMIPFFNKNYPFL